MPIEAICEKYVGIFSFSWVFCSAAEFPNPLRSWRVEGLVNSEQRRRFNRLVNRLTKILSEAGTQEPTKNGQRLAGYIAIALIHNSAGIFTLFPTDPDLLPPRKR